MSIDKRVVQYEIWKECRNHCKFCFLKSYQKNPSSLTKSLETPVYKGFERGERFLKSLPNLSTIPHATLTGITS